MVVHWKLLLYFLLICYEDPSELLWLDKPLSPWLEEPEPACPVGGAGRVLKGGLLTPPFLTTPSFIGRLFEVL